MTGTWTTVDLGGKPADVFDPPGAQRPRFALLFLHAYDVQTLRDNPTYTGLLAELRLGCVCPQGGYYWWVDRPCSAFDTRRTPEKHLLDVVVPFCRERWMLPERAVGLLGFSMGGQAALRLALKYPDRFPVAAALAPALEYHELHGQGAPLDDLYDSKEQCRQDTAPMHIQPGHVPPHLFFACDPDDAFWFRGCDRLREKLRALGVEHEADLETRAGGHTWQYFNHQAERAVRFVAAGLEKQSLRLL
jgi:S-formylglutathione hydrolase